MDNDSASSSEYSTGLYVQFPPTISPEERSLFREFKDFDPVAVKIIPGQSYAFVNFENHEDAAKALRHKEGKVFDNPLISVTFSQNPAFNKPPKR